MADIDFTPYLAGRREQQGTPVTVTVGDRAISFRVVRTAAPLLDLATGADPDNLNTIIVSRFFRDSLSDEDFAYLYSVAADPASGFDQDAFYALFRQVTAEFAGRPTTPSSTS